MYPAPYPPVVYQPPVAYPPPVAYAPAASSTVVQHTTVKHYSSKGGRRFRAHSSKGRYHKRRQNKGGVNIHFGKKVFNTPSGASKKKADGTHLAKRDKSKKKARDREAKKEMSIVLGPQIPVQISDSYTLRSLFERVSQGVGGAVHNFSNAVFQVCRENGGLLPKCEDVSLEVQHMVSRALHSRKKRSMMLTFVNEKGERAQSSPARPVPRSTRAASVAFQLPSGTTTSLNGPYSIELRYGSHLFVHSGVFTESSRTIHGDGETFHWLINLYDQARFGSHYKYKVPLPSVELTMTRSRTDENVYVVDKAVLVVDYEPRKHLSSLVSLGSDVVEVPGLHARTHRPYKAHMRDNVALHRLLHGEITARLSAIMGDTPNKWVFRCPTGTHNEQEVGDHRVFLGTVSEAAVAYAVMNMLASRQMLDRVDDPEFIKEIFKEDANGLKALDVVASLYDKYHSSMGGERTPAHQDFPSVLQLLMHTSGLPSSRSIRCDQVRAYYLRAIAVLNGAAEEETAELPYDKREEVVLDGYASAPGADNDADVSVGEAHNTFEAFLLAMFVRRFAATTHMAKRSPSDIINAHLKPSDFKVTWGTSLNPSESVPELVDPLVFSACASSTFSGLSAHVRALADELAQPSRANSVFFRMLSTRFPVGGEDSNVVHSAGWLQRRANDKLDVLFVGSNNDTVDTVVAVIVPQLAYYGVFHELSANFERPLSSSVESVVDAVTDALNAEGARREYERIPDRVMLDIAHPVRSHKAWDTSFLPVDVEITAPLPSAEEMFVEPFMAQLQGVPRTVRFVRDGIAARLVFSTGEEVQVLYDPRRNGFFVRPFEEENSQLGSEVVVTPEYIQYDGLVYMRAADFDELRRRYAESYETALKLANADVFNTRRSLLMKQGVVTPVTPAAAFSLDTRIGHSVVGPLLGGAVLGATAASLANPYGWGPVAPYYPYGYPYYGYGYGYGPRRRWLRPRGYYRRRRFW